MIKQLSLFDGLADTEGKNVSLSLSASDSDRVSISDFVSDAKQQAIQRFLNSGDKETIACVTTYSPGGRDTKYFRLSYRVRRKMKHIHIKGGSTIAELAQYRAKKLQTMIDRGAELEEVLAAVRTFNGAC